MAFLALTSAQCDANSPLDETLMQTIRTDLDDLNSRTSSTQTFSDDDIRTHFATNGLDATVWDSYSTVTAPGGGNHWVEVGSAASAAGGAIAAANGKMRVILDRPHSLIIEARVKVTSGDNSSLLFGLQDVGLVTAANIGGGDISDLMVVINDGVPGGNWHYYSAKAGVNETGTDFGLVGTTSVIQMEILCVSSTNITVNVYQDGVLQTTHTDETKMPTTTTLRPVIGASKTGANNPAMRCDYFRAYWTTEPLDTL